MIVPSESKETQHVSVVQPQRPTGVLNSTQPAVGLELNDFSMWSRSNREIQEDSRGVV